MGNNCEHAPCYGKAKNDPTVCSGNGVCSNLDQCTCQDNYYGPHCSMKAFNIKASLKTHISTLCSPITIDLSATRATNDAPIQFVFKHANQPFTPITVSSKQYQIPPTLFTGESSVIIEAHSYVGSSHYSTSKEFPLLALNYNAPISFVKGRVTKKAYVNEYFKITGSAIYNPACGDVVLPDTVIFEWKQIKGMDARNYSEQGEGQFSRFITFPKGLPQEFAGETLTYQLTVYPEGYNMFNVSTEVEAVIELRPIRLLIEGKDQMVKKGSNFTIRCETYDPSQTNEEEEFIWSLTNEGDFSTLYPMNNSLLVVPSTPFGNLGIHLLYKKGSRTQQALIRAKIQENVINTFISSPNNQFIMKNDIVTLIAETTNLENVEYEWYYANDEELEVPDIKEHVLSTVNQRILLLDTSKIENDIPTIQVRVKDLLTNDTGIASYQLLYSQSVTVGENIILPTTGLAYNTTFKIAMLDYQGSGLLSYSISYLKGNRRIPLLIPSDLNEIELELPSGDPEDDYDLTLILTVSNTESKTESIVKVKVLPSQPTQNLLKRVTVLKDNIEMTIEEQLLSLSQIVDASNIAFMENITEVKSKSSEVLKNLVDAIQLQKSAQMVDQVSTISESLTLNNGSLNEESQDLILSVVSKISNLTEDQVKVPAIETMLNTVSNLSPVFSNKQDRHEAKKHIGTTLNNIGKLALRNALPSGPPIVLKSNLTSLTTERFIPQLKNYTRQIGNESLSFSSSFTNQFNDYTNDPHSMINKGLGIIIKQTKVNTHEFLDSKKSDLGSSVFSVQFDLNSNILPLKDLTTPFEFELSLNASMNTFLDRRPVCSFWDEKERIYSNEGCKLLSINNATIRCSCNHTTDFGVILDYIPKFNLLTKDDSIVNLNIDNMTTAIIFGAMMCGYFSIMFLMQVIDSLCLLRIRRLKRLGRFKELGKVKFGTPNDLGQPQYLWPLWVKFRESHLWFAVIFSRISEQQTFTKQQRLTILMVLILSIFLSNALTVGLGGENETEYVIAAFVADFFTQPFSLILAFFFAKIKPNQSEQELLESVRKEVEKGQLAFKTKTKEESYSPSPQKSFVKDSATYQWKMEQEADRTPFKILCTILHEGEYYVLTKDSEQLNFYTYELETGKWCLIQTTGDIPDDTTDYNCIYYENSFYVFWTTYDDEFKASIACSALDIDSLNWTTITCSNSPNLELGYSLTHIDNRVFVFGGVNEKQDHSNCVYGFNLETKHWKFVLMSGDVPSPRLNHAACKLNESDIFIHGGQYMSTFYDDSYIYNSQTGSWIKLNITQSLMDARAGHAATVVPNDDATLVALFGGFNENEVFADMNMLVIESQKWLQLSPLNNDDFEPEENFDHDMISHNSQVYVFGGVTKPHLLSCSFDNIHISEESISLSSLSSSSEGNVTGGKRKLLTSKLVDKEAVDKNIGQMNSLVQGIVLEVDKRIHFVVKRIKTKNMRVFGIIALLLSSIVYFGLTALGCYLMLLINWLGPIGTSTYGALAVVSYVTLIMQIYLTAKRKMFVKGKIRWKTRFSIVNLNLTLLAIVLITISLAGSMYGVSTMQQQDMRIGMYVIMVVFHLGLYMNAFTWMFHIFVKPRRKKSAIEGLLSRPWFPHWFKYIIYVFSWLAMCGIGVLLIMYGIRFNRIEGSEHNWYMACFFGNTQNFALDEMLAFIASSIILVAIARLFEIFLFPREIIIGGEDSDEEDFVDGNMDIPERFRTKETQSKIIGYFRNRVSTAPSKEDTETELDETTYDFFDLVDLDQPITIKSSSIQPKKLQSSSLSNSDRVDTNSMDAVTGDDTFQVNDSDNSFISDDDDE
eukprot:CAMPEP_0117420032 /NCGR_PEP_ID=MMETSP0758-20121206/1464_1 /TAXON_ID=63605 /ORGANISM="Percolomonas cosmopolitus, Strain AE-1 (ATCC 50343)" /LENGTH=1816 /DNA_ID=CAMNT_0005201431 /DNA_START=1617 /DNA_END=7064 /DNA_ORIENTATION=+